MIVEYVLSPECMVHILQNAKCILQSAALVATKMCVTLLQSVLSRYTVICDKLRYTWVKATRQTAILYVGLYNFLLRNWNILPQQVMSRYTVLCDKLRYALLHSTQD